MNPAIQDHLELGIQKFFRYDRDGAVVEFRKALLIEPENDVVIGWLATSLAQLDRYDEASEVIKNVKDSNSAEIYIARGLLCGKRDKNPQKAIENFNQAISIDPSNQLAYVLRGREYAESNMKSEAISDLGKALAIKETAYALFAIASVKGLWGDFQGAIEYCNKALELDPDFYNGYGFRAVILAQLGDTDGALKDYSRGLELYPRDKYGWTYRGILRAELNDYSGALQDLNRALEIDSNELDALAARALVLRSLGKYELSLSDQSKFYELGGITELDFKFQNRESRDIFETVRNHIRENVISDLAKEDEKFIDYWESYFYWGDEQTQSMRDGRTTRGYYGKFGLGYLCLTNRYLRIYSLGGLSKKYAKSLEANALKRIFHAVVFSNHDLRLAEGNDINWTIPFKDIHGIFREENNITLATFSEKWDVMLHRGDIDYLLAALELARTGNLSRIIDIGNLAMKPSTTKAQDDIFTKIEKLASLRDRQLISQEEFELKKKELLARL